MGPRIAVVYYSTWGHIAKLARAEASGIKEAGGACDIFQLPETLPKDVLAKMHAPPKDDGVAVLNDPHKLTEYDGFLFGIPTRYGNFPAQWKTVWDATGRIWQQQGFHSKFAGLFVSTATAGGGQESTALATMSTLAHHGIIYVPLGYKTTSAILNDLSEVRGGSPWGAGTFSAPSGERQPSDQELALAKEQGRSFYQIVSKVDFGSKGL